MPQPRGEVPPAMAAKLQAARAALLDAQAAYEAAVLEALEAGGSYREVGRVIGIDSSQVMKLAHRLGWPPQALVDARKRAAEENRKWRDVIRGDIDQRWRT